MTEAEWLACTDPSPMLESLRGRASERKLRLFAVACCRLFWDSLNIDATRAAIEQSERYADGQATERELSQARSAAHNAGWGARYYGQREPRPAEDDPQQRYYRERLGQPTEEVLQRLYFVAFMANTGQRLRADEMPMLRTDPVLRQSSPPLFRCIFGNLFRPVTVDPAVLTPSVGFLASAAYDVRILPSGELDPARLAVLSDALEEAGCTDADLLTHLRSPGPHVRGCWALDLILGKE